MKSVALHNLGCKVNAYELDVMQQMLQEKGYKIVPFDATADIYIINTCTVTNIADRKSRQMLHRAKKQNPDAIVVAVGCYVQTGRAAMEKDDCIDLAVGNNKKKELPDILEAFLKEREGGGRETQAASTDAKEAQVERTQTDAERTQADTAEKPLKKIIVTDLKAAVPYEEMRLEKTAEHTRAYIKIQDGCNQFCSYCIIPFARGRVRSRRPQDILEEAEGIVRAGYQEIVITGIHISSYGMDFIQGQEETGVPRSAACGQTGGSDTARQQADGGGMAYGPGYLLRLIERLHEIEGLRRIRLGSLEPRIITREFAEGLSGLPKVCPHFHLSLQSGCDATLKRMNRRYLTGEYYEKVRILRAVYHNPAITTDVITGFPGETEEEFEESRRFLERVGFYEIHIFKYSRRQGTSAAKMPMQVPGQVKAQRSGILMELERRQSLAYRKGFIGKELEILFEEAAVYDGKAYMVGHTREYVKAAVQTEEDLSNRVLIKKAVGFLQENIVLVQ